MPDTERFQRKFISSSFNRDSVIAAALGASFNLTSLFGPMIERRAVAPELAGSKALELLVPNVGILPWEAVIEFRDNDGSSEARDQLREFERLAAEQEPQDGYEFLLSVGQEVTRAQRAATEELAPRLPEELGKQLLLGGVSLIPAIGGPASHLAAAASAASESRTFKRSWIAALMKLAVR